MSHIISVRGEFFLHLVMNSILEESNIQRYLAKWNSTPWQLLRSC